MYHLNVDLYVQQHVEGTNWAEKNKKEMNNKKKMLFCETIFCRVHFLCKVLTINFNRGIKTAARRALGRKVSHGPTLKLDVQFRLMC